MVFKILCFAMWLYWWFKFNQATKEHNNTKQIEYGVWWLSMFILLLRLASRRRLSRSVKASAGFKNIRKGGL